MAKTTTMGGGGTPFRWLEGLQSNTTAVVCVSSFITKRGGGVSVPQSHPRTGCFSFYSAAHIHVTGKTTTS